MASRSPMASRRLSRKPGCLNLAMNLKEINSASNTKENLSELDVAITGTAERLRDGFGPHLHSPTILVDTLSAMVEASDMDLQHLSTKEKTLELGEKGHPINRAGDLYMHSPDWSFMARPRPSNSNPFDIPILSHCPSLTSGSTVSSRNSSTRSAKSQKWPAPERLAELSPEDIYVHARQRQSWDDRLDAMNTKPPVPPYEVDRPHKCPIKSCEYHVRGFIRVFDRLRHTNTHFTGTLVCGFCPSGQGSTPKKFDREDVFSRHLTNVHRAKQGSAARRKEIYRTDVIEESQRPSTGALVATCTQCLEPFDVQGFYEHLPGCTYRRVMRDAQDAHNEEFDDADTDDEEDSLSPDSPVLPHEPVAYIPLSKLPSLQEVRSILQHAKQPEGKITISTSDHTALNEETVEMEELTASSRCLSLTSSRGITTSDDETDCTVDDFSPESDTESVAVQPMLSPLKRQLIDRVMVAFHSLLEQSPANFRTNYGGNGSESSHGYAESSSHASSSGDSPLASRKRSLSGGGSTPPNDRRNDGDDHKRRRADAKIQASDLNPDLRLACPYYKRNPGRHQTFTSCRDPGFITVARLKEHLYRRHLLPIQCNRCCTTFPTEPALREHQRDRRGCEVKDHVPIEGFDKDQERKLKSKKRSLVHQSEEDKWRTVYRILFPDDNDADMPSPFIEYRPHHSSGPSQESNVAHFQEFSRLELPRLVRRTLEAVVEQEAQPLEEKLKERLVDIVEQCQSQLISMFQSIGGTINPPEPPSPLPASSAPPPLPDEPLRPSPHDSAASRTPNLATFYGNTQYPIVDPRFAIPDPTTLDFVNPERPSNVSTNSGSPDSGYDSTWTAVGYPPDCPFDPYFSSERGYMGFEGFEGFRVRQEAELGFDSSMWTTTDPLVFDDRFSGGSFRGV